MVPNSSGLGLSKEQTYCIAMSLYAIKVQQKSELKSANQTGRILMVNNSFVLGL